jgi:hypothetical protein
MNGEIPLSIEMHLIDLGILSHHDLDTFDAQDDPALLSKCLSSMKTANHLSDGGENQWN